MFEEKEVEVMRKQLPLCVGIVCTTAVIITMIACKMDPTGVVVGIGLSVAFLGTLVD